MWTPSINPNPYTKLSKGMIKGPCSKTLPCAPSPKCSGMYGKKGPSFPGGDTTEETMDVSGPAQEQETSFCKGTGARDELIWQTSKRDVKKVGCKDRGPKVWAQKTHSGWLLVSLELRGGRGEGGGDGVSLLAEGRHFEEGWAVES